MTLPTLPDWLPWWVSVLVMIPLGLWLLSMLVMPFSVIGVKSRLDGIEARLDELQAELRSLVLRLPESPAGRISYRQDEFVSPAAAFDTAYAARPPIPPQPRESGTGFIPRRPGPGPQPLSSQPLSSPSGNPQRGEDPSLHDHQQRGEDPRLNDYLERRDDKQADPAPRPAPSPRAEPRLDFRR